MNDNKKNGNTVIIILFLFISICSILGTIAFVMEMTQKKCCYSEKNKEKFAADTDENKRCKSFNNDVKCASEGCYWDDDSSKTFCREFKCEDINDNAYRNYHEYQSPKCQSTAKVCSEMKTDLVNDCNNNINCKWNTDSSKCVDKTEEEDTYTMTSTFIYKNPNTGLYMITNCSSPCEMNTHNKMVCNNIFYKDEPGIQNNVCLSKKELENFDKWTNTYEKLNCHTNNSDKCMQLNKDYEKMIGSIAPLTLSSASSKKITSTTKNKGLKINKQLSELNKLIEQIKLQV